MSEVDKPFDIPSHWEWRRLDQVGEVHSGSTPSTKEDDNFGGEIPWLTPGDLSEYEGKYASRGERNLTQKGLESCSAKLLPEGSILFSSRAPIGYTVITQNPISTNQGFKNLVPGESIDEDYAYHYLKGSTGLAKSYASGTTFSELSATRFAQIPIPLPPLPEQRRIVAKIEELFSNLDAGMADLQVAGQQLERYRLSVLQAAVEGRLTADWRRTHDPKPADQLLERILEKRRERWEEDYRTKRYDSKGKTPPDGWKDRYSEPDPVDSSDLPSLPSSWKWVRFEQISLLDSGYAFSSDKFTDEGMPLLRGANVAPGHLKWGDTEYWPEDEVGSYEHLIVEEGDIILAMDRPLINAGLKIARAEESDTPCLLVQRVARFKPVFESLTAFLYLTCSTQRFIAHLREGQTGTQIPTSARRASERIQSLYLHSMSKNKSSTRLSVSCPLPTTRRPRLVGRTPAPSGFDRVYSSRRSAAGSCRTTRTPLSRSVGPSPKVPTQILVRVLMETSRICSGPSIRANRLRWICRQRIPSRFCRYGVTLFS